MGETRIEESSSEKEKPLNPIFVKFSNSPLGESVFLAIAVSVIYAVDGALWSLWGRFFG